MSESIGQSDLRRGYKEVQIGPRTIVIPTDWQLTSLSPEDGGTELVTDGSHYSPDQNQKEEYYYATVSDLTDSGINFESCGRIDEEQFEEMVRGGCKPKPGDVLFSKDGTVGICTTFTEERDVVLLSSIAIIRPNTNIFSPSFLSKYLSSKLTTDQVRSFKSGTALKRVILRDIKKFQVPTPPLPEQRRIADILSTVDEQIQQTDEIVNKTEELKRGVLNELIPRGINEHGELRLSPEDQPELYEEVRRCTIPTEWEIASLQELCKEDVTYGIVQAGPHVDDGVPYIKTGDMTDGNLELEGLSRASTEIAENYNRSKIRTGELVITIRATVGVVHQVPPELDGGNLTQGTARISPKDAIDNRYLLWAIRTNLVQSLIDARTKGSTFNEVTLGTLRKVPIPYPERLEEQQRIAEKLDKISEKLERERSYLAELKDLKRGLMQDLLTGKIRVDTDT